MCKLIQVENSFRTLKHAFKYMESTKATQLESIQKGRGSKTGRIIIRRRAREWPELKLNSTSPVLLYDSEA